MSTKVRSALTLGACLAFAWGAASGASAQAQAQGTRVPVDSQEQVGGKGQAQGTPSTPFVIHGVPVDGSEQVATKGQALLAQPATSIRAARLESATSPSIPAGTRMFGAYAGETWSYCAAPGSRELLWNATAVTCYLDDDEDGAFEAVVNFGLSFHVPLLVYAPGPARPLETPVPYSRIPLSDGPSVEYAIGYRIVRPSGREMRDGRRVPRQATHIVPITGFKIPGSDIRAGGDERAVALEDGQRATVQIGGAVIEILAVNDDDSVRYRVVEAMPTHIHQFTLQLYAYMVP